MYITTNTNYLQIEENEEQTVYRKHSLTNKYFETILELMEAEWIPIIGYLHKTGTLNIIDKLDFQQNLPTQVQSLPFNNTMTEAI